MNVRLQRFANLFIPLLLVLGAVHAQERTIAFPGAEGFGKFATGGRGGKVYVVTNLNNSGVGSFREAAEAKGPRVIVFAVSGTIHLETPLSIKANATIAGQTAPGDGICIADQTANMGGDNIIMRYMRFRMGDKYQRQQGMVDGSGGDDAFGASKRTQIIIDHCSFSWSTDEVLSVYNGDSTTLQWNMIYEPLDYSYHFETGDKDWEHHGFGGIWGGQHLTAHHNLFAHCKNRNPRFNGVRQGICELVDYTNNVIYNWGINTIYAGEGGNYNVTNNYFKYGPSTSKNARKRLVNPGRTETIPFGKWYVSGNYVDEAPEITQNNFLGVLMSNDGTEEDKRTCVKDKPHEVLPVVFQSAVDAFALVLKYAGASYRRDTLDTRIAQQVKDRTGSIIDVQGGYPHHTPFEQTLSAWPVLRTLPAPTDSDADGMPDIWELENKLDPRNAADAKQYTLNALYTNIEVYINRLVDFK